MVGGVTTTVSASPGTGRAAAANGQHPSPEGFPPGVPRLWTRADVLALSAERAAAAAAADAAWRAGYAQAETALTGAPGYTQAVADAYAAGQRDAYTRRLAAFDAGWVACWARFSDLIGAVIAPGHCQMRDGRIITAGPSEQEIRRWTRHHPRCRHGGRGGTQSCQRSGCLPGSRAEFAKAAPWDRRP